MKRDKYQAHLDAVVAQATTLWDLDKMRDAMVEARAKLETKYMTLKREKFAQLSGIQK